MSQSKRPTLRQLRNAIDGIFEKYDTDKSGTLEQEEVVALLTDSFRAQGRLNGVTQSELQHFVEAVDSNHDGKIDKNQLFQILVKVMNFL